MKSFRHILLILTSLLVLATAFVPVKTAHAAMAANWRAGAIIDDGIFYNGNDWSVEQIQQFLNNLVPTCDTWGVQPSEYGGGTRAQYGASRGYPAPYICLRDYYENPTTHENNLTVNAGQLAPIPAGAVSAAQIIKAAASSYGISVRALLVLLHKESAGPLTIDTWPFPNQYRNAMGYGCPDTAPCDPSYAGFYNQVTNAARQFKVYRENATNYRHVAQQNNSVLYNPVSSCGSSTVFIKTTATAGLYNYTPYQPNAAALANLYGTGDACSAYGNRNFWRIFTDWFGNPLLPSVYKTPSGEAVYLQTGGYKFNIPSMAMLQDYGFDPSSIASISQDLSDTIPSPGTASGLSSTLSYLVKSPSDTDSDGPTLYLVSLGRKYPVPNMSLVSDYSLSTSTISYLPLSFLQTLPTDALATNFIRVPSGSLFRLSGGQKQLIFDSAKYSALSQGSYAIPVSEQIASFASSGNPLSTNPVILKSDSSAGVYAYANDTYYAFPNMDTLRCWGMNTRVELGLNIVTSSYLPTSIVPSDVLSCLSHDTSSNKDYVLSKNAKYIVPGSYGFSVTTLLPSSLSYLWKLLPDASSPLSQAVKAEGMAPVWYLENGVRNPIPSYANLTLLGLANSYTTLDPSSLSSISQQGIKLATGQVVKTSSSPAVYVINGNKRIAIPSVDSFTGYRYSWQSIETYDPATLDASYPIDSGKILRDFYTDAATQRTYAIGPATCYSIPDQLLPAYAQDAAANMAAQDYSAKSFPFLQLSQCTTATTFIKSNTAPTVYRLNAGSKQPLSSWTTFLSLNGGSGSGISVLSASTVANYPTGSAL